MLLATISHHDEMISQFPFGVEHWDIALVFFHHANDHFGRQIFKISLRKSAQQSGRLFNQISYLSQQIGVIFQNTIDTARQLQGLLPNVLAALSGI